MDIATGALSGLVLPPDQPLRRASPVPEAYRDAAHEQAFDAHTLFYDCVHVPAERGLLFTAPPFENLWTVFRDGLRIDGAPVRRLRRRRFGRCEQVLVRCAPTARVEVVLNDGTHAVAPRRPDPVFRGRNLLLTKSRDNDIAWIVEWARFHARDHGADALLLFDNGSTAYDLAELAGALEAVPGMEAVRLVSAPYPFGDHVHAGGKMHKLIWLEIALLNLARRDMAAPVRAVLSTDIDEMVLRLGGTSVFDAARRSPVGGIMIGGSWVYPAPDEPLPCLQHRNTWRAVPDRGCHRKWCSVPSSAFNRLAGWQTHSFGGDLLRAWRGSDRQHPGFVLAHCTGTTTGWKSRSVRFERPEETAHDTALEAALKP